MGSFCSTKNTEKYDNVVVGTTELGKEHLNKNNNADFVVNADDILKFDDIFRFYDKSGYYYVDSVYDGDTFTILVPMVFKVYSCHENSERDKLSLSVDKHSTTDSDQVKFYKVSIRLFGVDAYEIRPSKDISNREEHVKKGKEGRDYVKELILNKFVHVEFLKKDSKESKIPDKYKRTLAKVSINGKLLADLLIEKDLGVPYFGGTKTLK